MKYKAYFSVMSSLHTVFWDVDETIAHTEIDGHRKAFNIAFNESGLNWCWDEKTYTDLLMVVGGKNRIEFYCRNKNININREEIIFLHKRKQFYYQQILESGIIRIRSGVERLISELNTNSIKQWIVTTSSISAVKSLFKNSNRLSLESFEGCITSEDVNKLKPDPEAYFKALSYSGKNSKNVIVIEDSYQGLKAACSANLPCLVSLSPWNYRFIPKMKDATSIVDSLGDSDNHCRVVAGPVCNKGFVTVNHLENLLKVKI